MAELKKDVQALRTEVAIMRENSTKLTKVQMKLNSGLNKLHQQMQTHMTSKASKKESQAKRNSHQTKNNSASSATMEMVVPHPDYPDSNLAVNKKESYGLDSSYVLSEQLKKVCPDSYNLLLVKSTIMNVTPPPHTHQSLTS